MPVTLPLNEMTVAEKLQLLGELWDSIAAEPASVPVSAQEKVLLEERWQEHLRDPKSALSLEEFKQRLSKYP